MFQNELDDSETLESINYEAEQKMFDEKLSNNFESFDLRFARGETETNQVGGGAGAGNMLETLRREIRRLSQESTLAKTSQAEVCRRTEEHAKMKREAEEVARETSVQARAVEEMTRTAGQKEERLRAGRSQRSSQTSLVEEQRKRVTAELAEYQQTLGLDILRSTRGGTLLIFSNINRDNPDRKFSLELSIGESTHFSKCVFGRN